MLKTRPCVFTRRSERAGVESIASHHTTIFTPTDLDYDAMRVLHEGSTESLPLLEVTKGERDLTAVMVPDDVAAGIAAGEWHDIVLLSRHLPGAQNKKLHHFVRRYRPLLTNFPPRPWVWEAMDRVRKPIAEASEPPRPFSVHRCLQLARNLKRWQASITSALQDLDEINGEVSIINDAVEDLHRWADDLEFGSATLQLQEPRKQYSASVLLRALSCSMLLRNKKSLVKMVETTADVIFPGQLELLTKTLGVCFRVIPSAQRALLCHDPIPLFSNMSPVSGGLSRGLASLTPVCFMHSPVQEL